MEGTVVRDAAVVHDGVIGDRQSCQAQEVSETKDVLTRCNQVVVEEEHLQRDQATQAASDRFDLVVREIQLLQLPQRVLYP